VVVYAGWSNYGYGNLIVIDHGNGWQTAYAHLSSLNVGCGQSVGQGQVIAGLGSTGNSTGPHLHFEMVYQGTKPNPMDYLH
jgi:murein DD-endopeptidase MepM/ murein hydrolase activator NlpD